MFGHATHINSQNEEIIKLRKQLSKIMEAFADHDNDCPCPSTVGLKDVAKCNVDNCGECWKNALREVK